MPKIWQVGEIATAANMNLLPRVLYRNVLTAAATTVTIANADINGTLADWETLKLTVNGDSTDTVFRALALRFNGDNGANYVWQRLITSGNGTVQHIFNDADNELIFGRIPHSTVVHSFAEATIIGHSRSDRNTRVNAVGSAERGTSGASQEMWQASGHWTSSAVVTSLTVFADAGTADLDVDTLLLLEGCMRREPI